MASYITKCLSPTDSSEEAVIQALIDKTCTLSDIVKSITDQINNTLADTIQEQIGNYLFANVTATNSLSKTGSAASVKLNFYGGVPPLCPIAYFGPLTNFNADGTGKVGTEFENWRLCTGNGQTVDLRGYVLSGAANLPGINVPTLDTRVSDINSSVGQRAGENSHQLSISEMPIHSHPAGDSTSITQNFTMYNFSVKQGSGAQAMCKYQFNGSTGQDSVTVTGTITDSTTGETGGNIAHENRQPTAYCYYIMRLS